MVMYSVLLYHNEVDGAIAVITNLIFRFDQTLIFCRRFSPSRIQCFVRIFRDARNIIIRTLYFSFI